MKRLFPGRAFNPGDRTSIASEERMENIQFNVHKFTPRPKPSHTDNTIIFPHFSEFGSELIESMYCLPMLLNSKYRGKYSIVLGWHGRSYLYRHLVDEFWELKKEHQWLREYARAFHHESKNLKKLEKQVLQYGKLASLGDYALITLQNGMDKCPECNNDIIKTNIQQMCLHCRKSYPSVGIYKDIQRANAKAVWVPHPRKEKIKYIEEKYLLKPNSVGITARSRKCYGRNLPVEFYKGLIVLLESMGYNPIWIGEKETTLRSPYERIIDYCVTEDANDLETTLALVSRLKFTVQFWTASTRLAGLVGTPYLLFESPDQIFGHGQEGIRMNLCTKGERKLVLADYINVLENQGKALELTRQSIREMEHGNYSDVIGMVENSSMVNTLRNNNLSRIGNK